MMFQGFNVVALGSAQLTISPQNTLLVSGIGSSGFDGVHIDKASSQNHAINFNNIPAITAGGVLRVTNMASNGLNQMSASSESLV